MLTFKYNTEISNIWNASISTHEDNTYTVKNVGWNQDIAPGHMVEFGISGQEDYQGAPGEYQIIGTIQENDESNYDVIYKVESDWGSGFTASVTIINNSDEVIEDWILEFDYARNITEIWNAEILSHEGNHYVIKNKGYNGNINPQGNVSFGFNGNDGSSDDEPTGCLLRSYGDGLSDQIELFLGTDCILKDTDSNGIHDGNEDFDEDEINNITEIEYGTSCLSYDTDGDGLSDYDEIYTYNTDPLMWDTDEDKLSDSVDIERGFDPLDSDTDDNGILDGDEVSEQTYEKKIEEERKPGVTSVAVSFDCAGDIEQEVVIISTYNIDLQSSNVVGLIGTPVDISTELEFDNAQIVFTYDENELGETDEDDLKLMWYDEENDLYVLLEDSVLDEENNTITYSTTHFSTYLIVDTKKWFDTWDKNAKKNAVEIEQQGDNKVSKETGTIYKRYEQGMTWDEAKKFCEDRGGHLVTITSQREEYIIESLMREGGSKNSYWLGAEKVKNQHRFAQWITGEPFVYNNFKYSQPDTLQEDVLMIYRNNNYKNVDCFGVWNDIFRDGGWGEFFGKEKFGLICEWNNIDLTDTDGDGLYDRYETEGMQLPNGQIIYSDPNNEESIGSGLTDYEHLGYPRKVTLTKNSEFKDCLIFHGKSAYGLSDEFIYVDGRNNKDGSINDQGMSFVPYCEEFENVQYKNVDFNNVISFMGETYVPEGAARIHNILKDKYCMLSPKQKKNIISKLNKALIVSRMAGEDVERCFKKFATGIGGYYKGIVDGFTRDYIDITDYITKINSYNTMRNNYLENLRKTQIAAEQVLGIHNNQIIIASSYYSNWDGCQYLSGEANIVREWPYGVLNFEALTTFNKAKASIVCRCLYGEQNKYELHYIYYLNDYYDIPLDETYRMADAFGIACSYELFGKYEKTYSWNK